MQSDLATIVFGSLGFVFVTMTSIIGYFTVSYFRTNQELTKKNTEALDGMSLALRDLTHEFKYSKREVEQIHKEFDARLNAGNEQMGFFRREEILNRVKFHWVVNQFQKLFSRAQTQGWEFKEQTPFPTTVDEATLRMYSEKQP